ncbi:amylo-alpha-1,6-glucosidase [Planosporangium mesophilum]|uniref:Glycogen debranching protein n=1 Tax=Planosporangium mesophilum TaxID=689768 RepID=A0A8J3TBX5_9ACTN|nr:amylo-alpha-1,6-glucosidase [Planosporangium mesophilum]NJC83552.1 amylo-alpha-1,6-glucosidase [Planosporangium mesophilum]GII22064.1 glycogen debranching protein [Planosporangium mesophilum]
MVAAAPIFYGPQVCGDLSAGGTREWLVADGRGGYAMGTVSGLRTRRYHGLLVVSGESAAARHVGLVALDPVITLRSGAVIRLGTHEWASGSLAPQGYRLLEAFTVADGLPRWRWRVGDVLLERELAMVHGSSSVAVVHRLLSGEATVTLEALCTWRDAHGERRADSGDLPTVPAADGVVIADAYRLAGPGWRPAGEWYTGAYAREEAERGLNAVEDLWYAGSFAADLNAGQALEVSAWAGDLSTRPPRPVEVIAGARRRAREVVAAAKPAGGTQAALALAADAFVIRAGVPDVVAGYPWFGAWSRDTMISYEGLFLETGRADEGRDLLRGYAATLSGGMLANTADTGATEYNTVDGTLWFLHAVDRHVARTGDTDLAAELVEPLTGVIDAHVAGVRYGIRVDPADGLLTQGAPGEALTWMDARVDGVPVTPRYGKPVEVNALWINGLGAVAALRTRLGRDTGALTALRDRATASFARRFPAPNGWLYDVVDGVDGPGGDDDALRPNQVLAWSLPYAPRPGGGVEALRAVSEQLLTPLGLRTLAPGHPAYRGVHRGGPADRDRAYHQGTVWPWLLGPYADAVAALGEPAPASGHAAVALRTVLPTLLGGIDAHLSEWGIGSVSETADADPPHRTTGCPFQAWSVAETLRISTMIG